VPRILQALLLLGVPGLAVGMVLGRVAPSWKVVALLLVVGGAVLLAGFEYGPQGDPDEDDDPIVVLYLMMLTNFATYAAGLLVGKVARR
jgi:hypothetical protein